MLILIMLAVVCSSATSAGSWLTNIQMLMRNAAPLTWAIASMTQLSCSKRSTTGSWCQSCQCCCPPFCHSTSGAKQCGMPITFALLSDTCIRYTTHSWWTASHTPPACDHTTKASNHRTIHWLLFWHWAKDGTTTIMFSHGITKQLNWATTGTILPQLSSISSPKLAGLTILRLFPMTSSRSGLNVLATAAINTATSNWTNSIRMPTIPMMMRI